MTYTLDDFMMLVVVSDVPFRGSPCWIWTGRLDDDGYGWISSRHGGRDLAGPLAHRHSYVAFHGRPIPRDKTVDHWCRTRSCVNPAHLRLRSNEGNVMDELSLAPSAINSRKTHCKHGHALTGDNLYSYTGKNGRPYRMCKTCTAERAAKRWREREAPAPRSRVKTHCKNGHLFTPETTHITSIGARRCAICEREYQKVYARRKRREAKAATRR